jgi:large subunit ribosomal protein L25
MGLRCPVGARPYDVWPPRCGAEEHEAMPEITLVAQPGRPTGSPEARRLRASGRIPAVVYGHGIHAEPVAVDGRELRIALSGEAGVNQLLNLEVAGTRHLALARVLQRHPVRGTLVHVDFQVVSRTEILSADVPVVLVGEAKAVETGGGVIEHPLQSLTINAMPGDIPNSIEVDITDLAIGDTIRVGDLPLPAGVTTDVDPDESVVVAALSEVNAEVEGLEAEEAAATAGETGDADSETNTES